MPTRWILSSVLSGLLLLALGSAPAPAFAQGLKLPVSGTVTSVNPELRTLQLGADTFYVPETPAPQGLDYLTSYFWQIVARDSRQDTTAGRIWYFVTEEQPNQPPSAPCRPSPADSAVVGESQVTLTWECGVDPDDDPVRFDLWVGRTPEPNQLFGRGLEERSGIFS